MKEHPELTWPAAPQWALSLGEASKVAIALAMAMFVTSAIAWLMAKNEERSAHRKVGIWSFWVGSLGIVGAFAGLATLFLFQQYQFEYVFDHSDNWLTPGFRLASVWGGQEGSFLLWATCSALFGLVVAPRTEHYRRIFTAVYAVFLAALAGILTYESPFRLLPFKGSPVVPPDGAGLNPTLANYWMQIHPPTIFFGFGSLTVIYAFALAALGTGDLDRWVKLVRPWALVCLTLLGIGLCMGGFWAYETLGWGGFWKWDPVENASLVPWLLMAAFTHVLLVQNTRKSYPIWLPVLGGLGLISFIYGTFLTRSGFLGDSSVHSFAEMNTTALWILGGLQVLTIGGLAGLAVARSRRKPRLEGTPFEPLNGLNLKNAYLVGSILLIALAVASLVGMSVPFIATLSGKGAKVVEEPTYNRVASYMFIPIMLLMGAAPFWGWRGQPLAKVIERTLTFAMVSMGILGFGILVFRFFPEHGQPDGKAYTTFFELAGSPKGIPTHIWVPILSFFCIFGMVGTVWRVTENWKAERSTVGGYLTHLGVIATMLGLIISRGLERKQEFFLQGESPGVAMGYAATMGDVPKFLSGLTARENTVTVNFDSGKDRFSAKPTLYYVDRGQGEPQSIVRPHVVSRPLYDLYVTAYPIQSEATEVTSMAMGDTKRFEGWEIRYVDFSSEGKPGQPGARFKATLQVTGPNGEKKTVTPVVGLTAAGPDQIPDEFGDFYIYMVSMDAGSKMVNIQLFYKNPIVPFELYFKPLTGLVWWGAGIMTVGGFLAAYQRRVLRKKAEANPRPTADVEPIASVS